MPEWQLSVDNHCGSNKPQHKSTNPSGIIRLLLTKSLQTHFQLYLETVLWMHLNGEGECPAGYGPGDWSDGSGECCCDADHQPGEGEPTVTTPVTTPGLIPYQLTTSNGGLIPYLLPSPAGLTPYVMNSSQAVTTDPMNTTEGLIPYLITSTPGFVPHLVNRFEEPVPVTDLPPTLPPVKPYEPAPAPPPMKYCKCRGDSSTPPPSSTGFLPHLLTTAPATAGFVPYLVTSSTLGLIPYPLPSTSSGPGLLPILLTSSSEGTGTGIPSLMTTNRYRRGRFMQNILFM